MTGEVSGEESPGVLSDDQPPESPSDSNDTDDTTKHMPWMKVFCYCCVTGTIYDKILVLNQKQTLCTTYCYYKNICCKAIFSNTLILFLFVSYNR